MQKLWLRYAPLGDAPHAGVQALGFGVQGLGLKEGVKMRS